MSNPTRGRPRRPALRGGVGALPPAPAHDLHHRSRPARSARSGGQSGGSAINAPLLVAVASAVVATLYAMGYAYRVRVLDALGGPEISIGRSLIGLDPGKPDSIYEGAVVALRIVSGGAPVWASAGIVLAVLLYISIRTAARPRLACQRFLRGGIADERRVMALVGAFAVPLVLLARAAFCCAPFGPRAEISRYIVANVVVLGTIVACYAARGRARGPDAQLLVRVGVPVTCVVLWIAGAAALGVLCSPTRPEARQYITITTDASGTHPVSGVLIRERADSFLVREEASVVLVPKSHVLRAVIKDIGSWPFPRNREGSPPRPPTNGANTVTEPHDPTTP